MNETKALLLACLENPAEDSVRLVYADKLDENGQHDRAEFIRVSIALAACGPELTHCDFIKQVKAENRAKASRLERNERDDILTANAIMPARERYMKHIAELDKLKRRADELLRSNWANWKGSSFEASYYCSNLWGHGEPTPGSLVYTFTRGFVSSVYFVAPRPPHRTALGVPAFARNVATVFATHPLQSVTVGFDGSDVRLKAVIGDCGDHGRWGLSWDMPTFMESDEIARPAWPTYHDTRADLAAAIPGWLTTALREPLAAAWRERQEQAVTNEQCPVCRGTGDDGGHAYDRGMVGECNRCLGTGRVVTRQPTPDNDNQNDPYPRPDVPPDAVDIEDDRRMGP